MDEIVCCQFFENDERIECGFLVGSKCKANKEKNLTITGDRLELLRVVGCQSFQRYFDHAQRREKFGEEAVGKERGEEPFTGRTANQMPLLPESEVGTYRGDKPIGKPVSMHILQEGSDCEGNTVDGGPVSGDLKCKFCGKSAVIKDCGISYCNNCAKKLGLLK